MRFVIFGIQLTIDRAVPASPVEQAMHAINWQAAEQQLSQTRLKGYELTQLGALQKRGRR